MFGYTEPTIEDMRRRFKYDPETGVITRLKQHGHYFSESEVEVNGKNSKIMLDGKRYNIRHFIWFLMTEEFPPRYMVIEPKDGDWSNVKWDNLRFGSRRKLM